MSQYQLFMQGMQAANQIASTGRQVAHQAKRDQRAIDYASAVADYQKMQHEFVTSVHTETDDPDQYGVLWAKHSQEAVNRISERLTDHQVRQQFTEYTLNDSGRSHNQIATVADRRRRDIGIASLERDIETARQLPPERALEVGSITIDAARSAGHIDEPQAERMKIQFEQEVRYDEARATVVELFSSDEGGYHVAHEYINNTETTLSQPQRNNLLSVLGSLDAAEKRRIVEVQKEENDDAYEMWYKNVLTDQRIFGYEEMTPEKRQHWHNLLRMQRENAENANARASGSGGENINWDAEVWRMRREIDNRHDTGRSFEDLRSEIEGMRTLGMTMPRENEMFAHLYRAKETHMQHRIDSRFITEETREQLTLEIETLKGRGMNTTAIERYLHDGGVPALGPVWDSLDRALDRLEVLEEDRDDLHEEFKEYMIRQYYMTVNDRGVPVLNENRKNELQMSQAAENWARDREANRLSAVLNDAMFTATWNPRRRNLNQTLEQIEKGEFTGVVHRYNDQFQTLQRNQKNQISNEYRVPAEQIDFKGFSPEGRPIFSFHAEGRTYDLAWFKRDPDSLQGEFFSREKLYRWTGDHWVQIPEMPPDGSGNILSNIIDKGVQAGQATGEAARAAAERVDAATGRFNN